MVPQTFRHPLALETFLNAGQTKAPSVLTLGCVRAAFLSWSWDCNSLMPEDQPAAEESTQAKQLLLSVTVIPHFQVTSLCFRLGIIAQPKLMKSPQKLGNISYQGPAFDPCVLSLWSPGRAHHRETFCVHRRLGRWHRYFT